MRYCLTLCIVILSLLNCKAQIKDRISYTASVEYGIDTNVPSYNPLGVKFAGLYNLNHHWGIGAQTGFVKYEKVIVPISAYGSYRFSQKKNFIPFIDTSVGYGLSIAPKTIGGVHLSVGVGTEYKVGEKIKLLIGLIYQHQALTRVIKYSNEYALTEFQEHLTHNSIGAKVGIAF